MSYKRDLSGQRFGRLLVIKDAGRDDRGRVLWECKCDCANIKVIASRHLIDGHTSSCGCLYQESIQKRNLKHGKKGTRIYSIYRDIITRCTNPKYKDFDHYGGKGVQICDEWLNKENGFEQFYEWSMSNGYTDELTIDRINTNGNYEPDNCRWVTIIVQANNKSTNVRVEYNNQSHTLAEWSNILNINASTLYSRYYAGKRGKELFKKPRLKYL